MEFIDQAWMDAGPSESGRQTRGDVKQAVSLEQIQRRGKVRRLRLWKEVPTNSAEECAEFACGMKC